MCQYEGAGVLMITAQCHVHAVRVLLMNHDHPQPPAPAYMYAPMGSDRLTIIMAHDRLVYYGHGYGARVP